MSSLNNIYILKNVSQNWKFSLNFLSLIFLWIFKGRFNWTELHNFNAFSLKIYPTILWAWQAKHNLYNKHKDVPRDQIQFKNFSLFIRKENYNFNNRNITYYMIFTFYIDEYLENKQNFYLSMEILYSSKVNLPNILKFAANFKTLCWVFWVSDLTSVSVYIHNW